jgi:Heparinase II/III N-terminus/Heparinase II/III-like protein
MNHRNWLITMLDYDVGQNDSHAELSIKAFAGNTIFAEGYCDMSSADLLAHFKSRQQDQGVTLPRGHHKHLEPAEQILNNRFNLNNETHQLATNFDWTVNPSNDLEWLILLHKFYYLKDLARAYDINQDERYAAKWQNFLSGWISQVPEGFIDSQVTGRRLQQWLLAYQYFVAKWRSPTITPEFFCRFLHSVHAQTQYLCGHLTAEGNHRTLELYAIFLVAITFPELAAASEFLAFSKDKLLENMQTDLLPDGVHRELSTDYHHTVLKNYLRFRQLAAVNAISLPSECDDLLGKALQFSYYVHKPDGFIPAINDGDCACYLPLLQKAQGYYPNPHGQYVFSQGKQGIAPPQRSVGFTHSGYYILRSDWASKPYHEAFYLFFDCAPLGFGSHGHYDALNFELAAYGQSLIVDPGRYTYSEQHADGINWRHYFKGSAAHNTIVIDGNDQIRYQCERPLDPEPITHLNFFITTEFFDLIQGEVRSHNYPVVHERTIFFWLAEYYIVADRLLAQNCHRYDQYFHLAPLAQAQTTLHQNDENHLVLSPHLLIAQPCGEEASEASINPGFVSPEYGLKQAAPIVQFSKIGQGNATFHTVLYPYKTIAPRLQVKYLPVIVDGRVIQPDQASALNVVSQQADKEFHDYFFISHADNNSLFNVAKFSCSCRMLFIRKDKTGHILVIQAESLSFLQIDSTILWTNPAELIQLNYQNKHWQLKGTTSKKVLKLSVEDPASWPDLLTLWECL